jgi:hypothetical protein
MVQTATQPQTSSRGSPQKPTPPSNVLITEGQTTERKKDEAKK